MFKKHAIIYINSKLVTGIVKMYFHRVLLFAISMNCFKIIFGVCWKTEYNSVYYNVFPISNSTPLNETLISDEKTATSVMACSLFCMKRERISLYYRQNESKCYCNTDIDTRLDLNNRTEDVASEILYGYINSSVHVSNSCIWLFNQYAETVALFSSTQCSQIMLPNDQSHIFFQQCEVKKHLT